MDPEGSGLRAKGQVERMPCTILGGGIAGLALACAIRERGIPFTLYEASSRLGGNAVTIQRGGFRFDAGAHRFHDQIPAATRKVQEYLGPDLYRVHAPSRIQREGRFIDFPLSPLNLARRLPPGRLLQASFDFLRARLGRHRVSRNLEEFAVNAYGRTIAGTFLLNYSEKLWGLPSRRLSAAAAGKRLRGLDLKTFLLETIQGPAIRTAHLDGNFYYPRGGIGRIAEALAARCPSGSLHVGRPVTAIRHEHGRIVGIVTGTGPADPVNQLFCTLPLRTALALLVPSPPGRILEVAGELRFRNVVVVALFLDRAPLSGYATTYFPEKSIPFTRIHEPQCRSFEMSPPGKTSLVAEIPCDPGDEVWLRSDEEHRKEVERALVELGWLQGDEILGAAVHRMHAAYPVPTTDSGEILALIEGWLGGFSNLVLTGRGALCAYQHIHDLIEQGWQAVAEWDSRSP